MLVFLVLYNLLKLNFSVVCECLVLGEIEYKRVYRWWMLLVEVGMILFGYFELGSFDRYLESSSFGYLFSSIFIYLNSTFRRVSLGFVGIVRS